ncbi:MAG: invasin domain 3-containing protein, partial [Methanoculleus sp.]
MCAYIVIAGLLLLVAPVGALVPDTVEIETSSEWLTAGSSDTAIITVQLSDSATANTGFGGATVEFAVDSAIGSITPAVATTNATGMATAVFTPATTSGTATITVTASYEDGGAVVVQTKTFEQPIDHAAPYRIANAWYSPEVTV